ncbi:hypothetical protein BTO20_11395 [Mycobacterium dioxanotrophicus]|uniref:Uncharacterized protein n=1 Tax=Mycobacterium dioxanotrophicus TaxID=482462 RepID=A0A1Y0C1S8_9MYCO|nr:hypothetical protein [Mycobacterium dioxanotrophicus]ART69108.1 hypothetical protein BTO20_11395 [Mycobacterium dioxanotrophicus]
MTQPANEDGETQPKPMNPRRLRQTLYWLALDWIHLHTTLPTPTHTGERTRSATTREYGHPAEWASDRAAEIVNLLTGWHDYLAEQRNETPPPTGSEERRLVAAWKYLEPRVEQLTQIVEAEALKELPDLHHKIRRALGVSTPKYTLPIPCPNSDCELRTLARIQGIGQDFISCDSCGYTFKEAHYPLLIRMTLDAYLNGAA